jgi:hypothetical protein
MFLAVSCNRRGEEGRQKRNGGTTNEGQKRDEGNGDKDGRVERRKREGAEPKKRYKKTMEKQRPKPLKSTPKSTPQC